MSNLSKEQIEQFKEQEKEAVDSWDYRVMAAQVSTVESPDYYTGDKIWAKKLLEKAEELAEDSEDYRDLGSAISSGDILGEWVDEKINIDFNDKGEITFSKSEVLEFNNEVGSGYSGIVVSKELKDWGRKLFKKAVELVEDTDDYEYLADSIEDEDYLGDEEWAEEIRKKAAEEIRKLDPRTNSDGVIVAKNFDNGTSQAQGNEVCIGGLNQDQISEIAGLLKKGTYLESDYFQSFFNYDELYHGNGILICETDDIYNASDKSKYSKGKWEFLEGEEDISDVIVKNDLYLVTCRVETVYFHAQLPAESKDIPPNETIELTALLDRINPMENIPWDYFCEECPEIPWFLFKGVKCKYGEFERDPMWEEGAGYIYNTYQMIFHKNELLLFISNRDNSSGQFPFEDTEDYCPYLVNENELDQDKLNKSIQKLEEATT